MKLLSRAYFGFDNFLTFPRCEKELRLQDRPTRGCRHREQVSGPDQHADPGRDAQVGRRSLRSIRHPERAPRRRRHPREAGEEAKQQGAAAWPHPERLFRQVRPPLHRITMKLV